MEPVPPTEGCCANGPVETVWGGRGVEVATTERPGLRFREPSSLILVDISKVFVWELGRPFT